MKKRRFWVRALLGLLAIGLLIGASSGAFRMGWWQGYRAAQMTDDGEGQSYTPGWPMARPGSWMHYRYPVRRMVPFGGGSLLHVGLLLGVLFLIGGLIRSCAWRASGHMSHKHWHHPHFGHHEPYGQHPPAGEHPSPGHCFQGKRRSGGEAASETSSKAQE